MMTKGPIRNRRPVRLVGVFLTFAWLASPGCNCEGSVAGLLVPETPTVNATPEFTNNPNLTIDGTRQDLTSVWLHFDYEPDARRAIEALPGLDWGIDVTLLE